MENNNWIECETMLPPYDEEVLLREYDFDRHGRKKIIGYTVGSLSGVLVKRGHPLEGCWNFDPRGAHLDWMPFDRLEELCLD